jgi:hypothetical protein
MDYKRILSLIHNDKNLEKNCEIIEKRINEIKCETNFDLPGSYIELLKTCDGGRFHSVYVPCVEKDGKSAYRYVDIVYGVAQDFWSIQRAYKQNWELILENGFEWFVSDFLSFAYDTGQVEKFKNEGVLPNYFESMDPEEDLIIQFYRDFTLYIDKLDTIISKLQYSDNRSLNAQIVFQYNMIKFFKLSLEFATDDGHGNFHLFYGDKNSLEPSIWYAYDLVYQYKVASNFKEFMKILVIERTEVCFGIYEINNEICSFINKLLFSEFNIEEGVTLEGIYQKILENKKEFSITPNEKIKICIRHNEYSDGSGFNEWLYKDYKFIMKVGPMRYSDKNSRTVFKIEYEEKILNIFKENRFVALKLLYTIGMNNLLEEMAKTDVL